MRKRVILALDAAWTERAPSGVCVVVEEHGTWRCAAIAPSYASFLSLAEGCPVDWTTKHSGCRPDIPALLAASARLAQAYAVDLVAIDMPLAICPIVGRRACDNEVSRTFGASKCGTHTPNTTRPGCLGQYIRSEFNESGLPLATRDTPAGRFPSLIEVYPHPALLRLMHVAERVPCKVSKSLRYWPGQTIKQRIQNLLTEYDQILKSLNKHIEEIPLHLPRPENVRRLAYLKPYEDALDALVSAWVGIEYLEGRANAFGDSASAIWIPTVS